MRGHAPGCAPRCGTRNSADAGGLRADGIPFGGYRLPPPQKSDETAWFRAAGHLVAMGPRLRRQTGCTMQQLKTPGRTAATRAVSNVRAFRVTWHRTTCKQGMDSVGNDVSPPLVHEQDVSPRVVQRVLIEL